ncbi:MAG: aspartate dehydrogenase [Enterobacteriaceae bacterium]
MKKVMLLGYGAMAHEVLQRIPAGVTVKWIVAREHHHPAIRDRFAHNVAPLTDPLQCEEKPDLVLECASQQAVAQYGEGVLERGWDLALISTGALADELLYQRLLNAAQRGGAQLQILSGAVAGMEGLQAAREGGLEQVIYRSTKSPASWRGSAAEQMIDLHKVESITTFFKGSAREAARLFPANANVAATIALQGIGMEVTQVELQVDPHSQRNTHTIWAQGSFGEMQIVLSGQPLASNPKTSTLAALSAVSACRRLLSAN